jgi:hypothetical protein
MPHTRQTDLCGMRRVNLGNWQVSDTLESIPRDPKGIQGHL